MDMCLTKLQDMVKDREAWHAAAHWGRRELDMTEGLNSNNKESHKYLPQFADSSFFLLQILTCFSFSTCPQLQVGKYLEHLQDRGLSTRGWTPRLDIGSAMYYLC